MEITVPVEKRRKEDNGYLNLIRSNKNFRYLWTGQIVSLLGDWFNLVASATLVAKLTESGTAIGGLFMVRMLAPFIVSPVAGVIVDRINRKYVLIISDIIRGIVVLGFLLVKNPHDVWLLYLLTFIQFSISGFFFPSRNAILPDIVPEKQLGTANALSSATWSVMLAVGSAIGGIIAGYIGIYSAFILDSVTFLISAILILQINYVPPNNNTSSQLSLYSYLNEYIDGIRYLLKHSDIFVIAIQKALIAFFSFGGFRVIQVKIAEKIFTIGEGGSTSFGIMLALSGIGTGIGPIVARHFTKDKPYRLKTSITLGYLMIIAGTLVVVPLRNLTSVLIGIFLTSFGGGIIWVFSTQLLFQILPPNYRGRIFSTEFALFTLMTAIGAGIVGMALDTSISMNEVIFWMGVLGLIPTLFWTLWFLLLKKTDNET